MAGYPVSLVYEFAAVRVRSAVAGLLAALVLLSLLMLVP
jgi:hypothetical protein